MKFTGERVVPRDMRWNIDTFQQHLIRYVWALQFVGGKTVADVACGTGYGADLLTTVATDVIGVDVDKEAIQYALDHYPTLSNIIEMNLEKPTSLPYRVDILISFETIEHLEDPQKFFDWVKDNTKLGMVGSIPINCPTEYHKINYTSEQIFNLVRKNLKSPRFFYQNEMAIQGVDGGYIPNGMILFHGGI